MLTNLWHTWLSMPKYDAAWHERDVAEELAEYCAASGVLARWSEVSDVVYTYTRARWSGHTAVMFPLAWHLYTAGLVYMFPKYTLRWLFFRRVARRMGSNPITEVRNPRKLHKLRDIAERNSLDPDQFVAHATKLLARWPLLP